MDEFPDASGYPALKAVPVIPGIRCVACTHAQSDSNARLTLACKAGKTQSYFSNQNGDMVTRARSGAPGERAPTSDSALKDATLSQILIKHTLFLKMHL